MAKRGRKKANDNKGYLDSNKENFTDYKVIDGNKITMKGVSGKIYAIPVDKNGNTGKGRLLSPNEEHEFENATQVIEIPEKYMQRGGDVNPQYQGFGKTILDGIQSIGNHVGAEFEDSFTKDMNLAKGYWANLRSGYDATFGDNEREQLPYLDNQIPTSEVNLPNTEINSPLQKINPRIDPRKVKNAYEQDAAQGEVDAELAEMQSNSDFLQSELDKSNVEWEESVEAHDNKKYNQDAAEIAAQAKGDLEGSKDIEFINPYGGVDLQGASTILGKSLGYDGDQKGANTARGVASGLKLLAGIGRNMASGYGQAKRSQQQTDEFNRRRKQALKRTSNMQQGGEIEYNPEIDKVFTRVMKSGGNSNKKPSDMLTGAYATGTENPNEPVNVEVEKGEHLFNNETGQVQEVIGKKHSQGGEKMNLDGKVLSDYNKIGGDLAKKYRDEFDIKVKAKDTFATAFDKVLKKTGYKSKVDEMSEYIEKTEKVQENAKPEDEATTGINMQFLSGKINEINKELQPLEELKTQVFSTMFDDQQGEKSPEELAQEGESEDVPQAKRGMEIDPKYYDLLSQAESGGDPNAEAPTSSAVGEFQFIESTWKNLVNQLGLDYTLEDRKDPEKARKVVEALTKQNEDILKRDLGRDPNNGELYLAHFLGITKARKVLKTMQENPNADITDVISPNQIEANPWVFKNMKTVQDLYGWSGKKMKVEGGLPEVPNELQTREEEGSVSVPNTGTAQYSPSDFPEVDTTEKGEFDGNPNNVHFQRYMHKTHDNMPNPTKPEIGIKAGEVNMEEPKLGEGISSEELVQYMEANRNKLSEEELNKLRKEVEKRERKNGRGSIDENGKRVALLPDQTPLPPSSLKIGSLQEVTPREAEAQLISPDAQLAEINRQFLTAKKSIDSLPASERVAALAKLNSTTQDTINQVMSQTNAQNAQIQNQTEQFNVQNQNNAELNNSNAAKAYEREAMIAMDNTNKEVEGWFNRIQENRMGNYLTVQEMNLMNQNYDAFQYDGNGSVTQTGKGHSTEEMTNIAKQAVALYKEDEEKKKKRGRKA